MSVNGFPVHWIQAVGLLRLKQMGWKIQDYDGNGKFRCNHRIKSWKEMQLEQYQDMSRGCMQ
ncbi:hypothetical protein CG810_13835 [Salmonella enterica subsp. enterica serovar Kentucky]|nr:hypothetical protein [Salmonella enterica subsp. enterica serovar Kentucky]EDH4360525.1 hypothetical protein [Salmonella enterica subsp. enterica serovar Kentucky]